MAHSNQSHPHPALSAAQMDVFGGGAGSGGSGDRSPQILVGTGSSEARAVDAPVSPRQESVAVFVGVFKRKTPPSSLLPPFPVVARF
jgi:hypothetical protein